MTLTTCFVGLFALLRSILSWPFRVIALMIGVPNVKIVYKSGHVEYYYFQTYSKTVNAEGHLTGMKWCANEHSCPFHIGINDIESIRTLY